MTRPRHPKPDANQGRIGDEIRQVPGFSAWDAISKLSDKDCPGDILVLHRPTGRWGVFEIKVPGGAVSGEQLKWEEFVPIVYTAENILEWFGRLC